MSRNIGDIIKCRRTELKMSQDELAKKLGYKSRSSVNKIELGKTDLSQTKIIQIANILELDPVDLLGLENRRKQSLESKINDCDEETLKILTAYLDSPEEVRKEINDFILFKTRKEKV